jgi:hypothetical protein
MNFWSVWRTPKIEPPYHAIVNIDHLLIDAYESDEPGGEACKKFVSLLKVNMKRDSNGKIWLDKEASWHELQTLCNLFSDEFGKPDENLLGYR